LNISLKEKKILITGGTSRLGRAFVEKAMSLEAEVYFTFYQNQSEADRLIHLGAKGFCLDLMETAAMDSLSKDLKTLTKRIDVLIHNAALVRDRTIQNMTEEEWDDVLNADLKAPYYLTKKLLPCLFKSPQGKIFFITSRIALVGGYGVSNYAAAKAGLIGLTQSLAQELGKKRILVNAVNPGFMKSKMTENLPEKAIQKSIATSLFHDWSDPEEVADFLIYLCSDAVTQVTSQVLHFESRKI